jgi:hypothetical protein
LGAGPSDDSRRRFGSGFEGFLPVRGSLVVPPSLHGVASGTIPSAPKTNFELDELHDDLELGVDPRLAADEFFYAT